EAALLPRIDRILLPLLGARVVVVLAEFVRNIDVGLLHVSEQLAVELLLQRLRICRHRRGVGVLRLEMRDDVGIRLLAQPEVVVDERVAMNLCDVRLLLRRRLRNGDIREDEDEREEERATYGLHPRSL